MLESDATKSAAKGVNYQTQAKIKHEQYRDIHTQKTYTYFETMHKIWAQACQLQTVRTIKNCLSKFENERYYLDACTTLAYGHPDIPKKSVEIKPSVAKKRKRCALPGDVDEEMDLTWKRRKPGETVFGECSRDESSSTSTGFIL